MCTMFLFFDAVFVCFGGVLPGKAEYRRVERYFKTSGQYWRERNRRKRVLRLREEEHLTQRQIAERLGVSERTVMRDLAKIRPYYTRRIRHYQNLLQEQGDREVDGDLEGKSPRERLNLLKARWMQLKTLLDMKNPGYRHHKVVFVLNFDEGIDGCPETKVLPDREDSRFGFPLTVSVVCVKNNRRVEVGRVILSQV